MTKRMRFKVVFVAALAAAFAIFGITPSTAYADDPCAATPPEGGFEAAITDNHDVTISIEFTAPGNATYACVTDYPGFPDPDPEMGALFYCYDLAQYPSVPQWTLAGISKENHVYIQYRRCQIPDKTGPVLDFPVPYWPAACDEAPSGTFNISIVGGPNVTSPNIQIIMPSRGNADQVSITTDSTFQTGVLLVSSLQYGYSDPTQYMLTQLGSSTVYFRFMNSCPGSTAVKNLSLPVTYLSPTCSPLYPPPGYYQIGSSTGNNNVSSPDVTLTLRGGTAKLVRIINGNNPTDLAHAPFLPYAATMPWKLPGTKGSHTVTSKFCNACGRTCSNATSYTFVLH